MRRVMMLVLCVVMAAIASCGGGGTPVAVTGMIGGVIAIGGPINASADLTVGLYAVGGTTALDTVVVGSMTISAATGSMTDRDITYQFTDLALGNYEVAVYTDILGGTAEYYRSDAISLTTANPSNTSADGTMSFSGATPWGTISGTIDLEEGDWPNSQTTYTYLGFKRGDEGRLQYPVTENYAYDGYVEHKAAEGQIIFNIDFLTYGDWTVGFYGYDYATHQVTIYGERDNVATVAADTLHVTGINFPAAFAGDPGVDPVLGTISGTISFNGDLPDGPYIAVGAVTIPPTAGAPVSHMDITPDMLVAGDVAYTLADVPEGTYGVSIFTYDMATHSVTYFGEYATPVVVTEATPNTTGIDFDADVSLI